MKYILIFISILSFSVCAPAMVQHTSSTAKNNTTPVFEKKSNSIANWFNKAQKWVEKKLGFTFDLSDPVDGWLSLALLAFALCLALGLTSWILGGLYLINVLGGVALIVAVISFWVWIYKAFLS